MISDIIDKETENYCRPRRLAYHIDSMPYSGSIRCSSI